MTAEEDSVLSEKVRFQNSWL